MPQPFLGITSLLDPPPQPTHTFVWLVIFALEVLKHPSSLATLLLHVPTLVCPPSPLSLHILPFQEPPPPFQPPPRPLVLPPLPQPLSLFLLGALAPPMPPAPLVPVEEGTVAQPWHPVQGVSPAIPLQAPVCKGPQERPVPLTLTVAPTYAYRVVVVVSRSCKPVDVGPVHAGVILIFRPPLQVSALLPLYHLYLPYLPPPSSATLPAP